MGLPLKFGMFIHFGLYALTEYHEQARWRCSIPRLQYRAMMSEFTLAHFDPDAWVELARRAGMEYICITTKHHDGFCMFDTQTTDFNIMHTPYGRDFLAELANACRRGGLKLSLYYSNPDWDYAYGYNSASTHQMCGEGISENIDRLKAYQREQIRELLTNYGEIYSFFWDIPTGIEDKSMNEMIRALQPGILINDRGWGDDGDYSTPERMVPPGGKFPTNTEACQSVGHQSWGYCKNEDYYTQRYLTASIDSIRARDGSYLLNVGPMPDGTIPPRAYAIVEGVGNWYRRICESFAGEPVDLFENKKLLAVQNDNVLYIHIPVTPDVCALNLKPLHARPNAIILLNDGRELRFDLTTRPTDWDANAGKMKPPSLHVFDLPVEEFYRETMVLKLVFSSSKDLCCV